MSHSLYEKAITDLSIISAINSYISEKVERFITDDFIIGILLDKNNEADKLKEEINKSPSLYLLDKFFAFWVYECSYSSNDDYCALITKFIKLRNQLESNPREESSDIDFNPLINTLKNLKTKRIDYELEQDDVVIVTAVPEEFRAFFRKIFFVVSVFNRNQIIKVLHPDSNPDDLKQRKKIWVEGIIQRKNKWVKIRLILTEEYGSVPALNSLSYIKNYESNYLFRNEIIVLGIAGHIDKSCEVKVGDLVISDSYYNTYPNKLTENNNVNTISYSDKTLKRLSDDYNVARQFNWKTWKPKHLLVERPNIKNSAKESNHSNVFKGSFISGSPVIKQKFAKETLQDNFVGALAVEMEAYGCYSFANDNNLKLKIIKAVCDWADSTKDKEWQPFCADLAAEFTVDYLIAKYGKLITPI